MRKLFTALKAALLVPLFVLGLSGAVWAADMPVEWKQSAGAVGYKIQVSEDLGATWNEIQNLTFTTFILLNETTQETINMAKSTITIADNVLVLVRVGAYNSVGTSWRLEAGIFYNSAWMPLPAPTGLGAN